MQWILDSYGILKVENRQATVGWVAIPVRRCSWALWGAGKGKKAMRTSCRVKNMRQPTRQERGKASDQGRHSWSFWSTLSIGGQREPQGQYTSTPQVIMVRVLQNEEYLQTAFSHPGFVRNVFPCLSIKSSLVIKSLCSTNLPLLVKISCKSFNLPHPVRFLFTQSLPPPPFLELEGLEGLTQSPVSSFFF